MGKIDTRREVEISLDFPVQLPDRILDRVVMRRPKLSDLLAAPIRDTSDLDGEMRLYARLCDLVPDELQELDMADYEKIQKQYLLFRGQD
ncbi:MAG: phage tail assembly protein [Desulfovibrio sp.]|nr:phage tail assembly protein [Desulfovibrio sp.]